MIRRGEALAPPAIARGDTLLYPSGASSTRRPRSQPHRCFKRQIYKYATDASRAQLHSYPGPSLTHVPISRREHALLSLPFLSPKRGSLVHAESERQSPRKGIDRPPIIMLVRQPPRQRLSRPFLAGGTSLRRLQGMEFQENSDEIPCRP